MTTTFLYGIHNVEALLKKHPERILDLLFEHKRHDRHAERLRQAAKDSGIAFRDCSVQELERLTSPETVHQGVVARARPIVPLDEQGLNRWLGSATAPLLLVLDGIQDPRNLGACIRTADAAAVDLVIIPKHDCAQLTAVAHKAASGASHFVPVARVANLARALKAVKDTGVWLVGADENAENVHFQARLDGAVGLVLGAEGRGLRRLTRDLCDHLVRMPMSGTVPSLNVSVAAGVLLYEAVRQRMALDP